MTVADTLSGRSDHIPDDKPELEKRIFKEGQIIAAVNEVMYKDELSILEGIREITPHNNTVNTEIEYMKEKKKDLGNLNWDGQYLRNKGKIYVTKDSDLRKGVLYFHHDTFIGEHRGPNAISEFIARKY